MKDINGNHLKVGDKILTNQFGVCEIMSDASGAEGNVVDLLDSKQVSHRTNFDLVSPRRIREMKSMCEEALAVQDASNLSGVVHSFSRTVSDIRTHFEAYGKDGVGFQYSTDDINRHAVCVMYASKVASLTGCEVGIAFGDAYRFCNDTVKGIKRFSSAKG